MHPLYHINQIVSLSDIHAGNFKLHIVMCLIILICNNICVDINTHIF